MGGGCGGRQHSEGVLCMREATADSRPPTPRGAQDMDASVREVVESCFRRETATMKAQFIELQKGFDAAQSETTKLIKELYEKCDEISMQKGTGVVQPEKLTPFTLEKSLKTYVGQISEQ